MKLKLHKKIKIAIFALFFLQIIFSNTFYASAGICIPCIFSYAESRYHLNLGSIQNTSETFNVSNDKSTPPQVMIFFNPTDPKPGEKVTAQASPMYFSNTKENLYYTWYIKHKKGTDNVEKWKEEAMRTIANGGWEPSDANGDGIVDDDDFDKYYGSVSDNDNDGFDAPMGGRDREGMNNYCYVHDFTSGTNYELLEGSEAYYSLECPSGYVGACIVDSYGGENGSFSGDSQCIKAGVSPYCDSSTTKCSFGVPRCVESSFTSQSGVCSDLSYSAPSCVRRKSETGKGCRHIFPKGPNGTETGDGTFKKEEEKFWKTNPQDSDTADNGNKDEANISGLGQDTFTWIYREGDEVGVAVEGTSLIPTKHEGSSYMIMWALPNNKCDVNDKDSYIKSIKGYEVSIPTAKMNINNCLKNNLVDPRGKGFEKIDVALSYSPENPMNDYSGSEMGDTLSISTIFNQKIEDFKNLYYEWKISAAEDLNSSFSDISKKLVNDNFVEKLEGMNLSKLDINLNLDSEGGYKNYFSNDIGYLKAKVTVKGMMGGKLREGRNEVVIKVNSTDKRIDSYVAKIDDSGQLFNFNSEDVICKPKTQDSENNLSYYICPVLKNQVLGLEVNSEGLSNFSWSINGNEITCDSLISGKCSGEGNTVFFPVTGNEGDSLNVKLIANDFEEDKAIEISRTFQIVNPYIKIISEDIGTFWPRALGSYNDLEGNQYADYSEKSFFTYTGAKVRLKAEFHPGYLENILENNGTGDIKWFLDEKESSNSKSIEFDVNKEAGGFYNIELSAAYQMPVEFRKALKDKWGIPQLDSEGETMIDSIQSDVISIEEPGGTLSFKKTGKVLASLVSNLPSQIVFLLRTAIAIFLIVLVAGISFSFSSGFGRNKTKFYE